MPETDTTPTVDLATLGLAIMRAQVLEVNTAAGWRGPDAPAPTFLESMALLHTEVSEAVEAFRVHGLADATADTTHGRIGLPKPEGVGSELADVLIRLLDSADLFGIDLADEYARKLAYNRTRTHRHGGKRI